MSIFIRPDPRVSGDTGWFHEPGNGNAFGLLTLNNSTFGYLRTEFPTEFWGFPGVATTVDHSLEKFFLSLLPKDPRIEGVYWFSENDVLKVWTVIPEPDFSLEEPLYGAQMRFIENAPPGYECDFSVIYRFDRSLDEVAPQGSRRVL